MEQSKVELISRYVNYPKETYDHLFILFIFRNGVKQVIRGGPFDEKHHYEFIFVHSQHYDHSIDNCKHEGYECSTPYNIYQGSDDEVKRIHNSFLIKAEEINRCYYDYKLPDARCLLKFKSNCHLQNSNTAVAQILKSVNMKFELPTRNNLTVDAIGYDQEFKHSAIDKFTGLLQMGMNLNLMQGNNIKINTATAEKLKFASDEYIKALSEQFDPIRKAQEKQLYPDNMICCLGDNADTCKQCDLMVQNEL